MPSFCHHLPHPNQRRVGFGVVGKHSPAIAIARLLCATTTATATCFIRSITAACRSTRSGGLKIQSQSRIKRPKNTITNTTGVSPFNSGFEPSLVFCTLRLQMLGGKYISNRDDGRHSRKGSAVILRGVLAAVGAATSSVLAAVGAATSSALSCVSGPSSPLTYGAFVPPSSPCSVPLLAPPLPRKRKDSATSLSAAVAPWVNTTACCCEDVPKCLCMSSVKRRVKGSERILGCGV